VRDRVGSSGRLGGGASSWAAKAAKQSILNCRKCDKTVFLLGKGKTKNEMKLVIVYKTTGRMLMVVGLGNERFLEWRKESSDEEPSSKDPRTTLVLISSSVGLHVSRPSCS